jgi:uncharacterized protein YaiL (DUF2058 family)
MASLQDQLLKAGLTTKQKARQANSDKRKTGKQKRSGVKVDTSLQEQVKQELELAKKDKLAHDTALNNERKQTLAAKEQQQRILQILQHHQVSNVKGEAEYNYTFNSKIKKLFVDSVTHKALVNGRLALCGVSDTTYIVTTETAEKVASLDKAVILVQNTKVADEVIAEDDPYAEFQIPDDMMW